MILLAAESKSGGNGIVVIGFYVLIFAAAYYFLIRPQRARARGVVAAQAAVTAGQRVILTSGIYGTVVNVDGNKVALEIAPGVEISVARAAVGQVLDESADEPSGDDDSDAPLN